MKRIWILLSVLALAAAVAPFTGPFVILLLAQILVLGIIAMSVDLLLGYTGLMSLGHAMFFAAGMYGTGLTAHHLGFGVGAAFLAGAVAGLAVAGLVEVTSAEDWRWAVEINLLGVVNGCRAAVPLMRRQRSGAILNIASSAGFAAAPQMGAYNASKAGVIALTETLAAELDGSGVQVSVAMPGFFRTGLLETMRAPAEESAMARRLMAGSAYDAADAARAILAATSQGRLYIVWPKEYVWLWRIKRFFPMRFLRHVQRMRARQSARAAHPRRG